MAIRIVVGLQASPSPTTLPRRIHFKQTLRSSRPTETVRTIYAINNPSRTAIRFQDSQGQPAVRVERSSTVSNVDQPYEHRIRMTGLPAGAFENVQIDQTLIPETGSAKGDVTALTVRR